MLKEIYVKVANINAKVLISDEYKVISENSCIKWKKTKRKLFGGKLSGRPQILFWFIIFELFSLWKLLKFSGKMHITFEFNLKWNLFSDLTQKTEKIEWKLNKNKFVISEKLLFQEINNEICWIPRWCQDDPKQKVKVLTISSNSSPFTIFRCVLQ